MNPQVFSCTQTLLLNPTLRLQNSRNLRGFFMCVPMSPQTKKLLYRSHKCSIVEWPTAVGLRICRMNRNIMAVWDTSRVANDLVAESAQRAWSFGWIFWCHSDSRPRALVPKPDPIGKRLILHSVTTFCGGYTCHVSHDIREECKWDWVWVCHVWREGATPWSTQWSKISLKHHFRLTPAATK